MTSGATLHAATMSGATVVAEMDGATIVASLFRVTVNGGLVMLSDLSNVIVL